MKPWKIALLLLLLAKGSASALPLSSLISQARIYLRDTGSDTSNQGFSDSQITTFLNNGQREVNLRVWAVVNATGITLQAGTTEYSMPMDNIAVLRVTINNRPVPERTFSFLDDSNAAWISDPAGTVQEYYVRNDSSVVSGVAHEAIGVHPVSSYTVVMNVQYLGQVTDLSAPGDIPWGALNTRLYPFHQGLAYYAAYRGLVAQGMFDMAGVYLKEYENTVALMENLTKTRLQFNPNIRGSLPAAAAPPAQQ